MNAVLHDLLQGQVLTDPRSHSEPKRSLASDHTLDQTLQLVDGLQGELDELRNQLAWSQRLSTIGTLAATLAHEINNLLTPVGIYAQLALKDPENKIKTQKALEAAVRGTEQARTLASAALGFAGPEGEDEQSSCDLGDVVDQAITCVRPALERSETLIELEIEQAHPLISALSLQQVLINLISNAERAMRNSAGRRQILIRSQRQGDELLLTIRDTGPGIPDAIRQSLFEPFITDRSFDTGVCNASNSDKTRKQDGTGLGLSICKSLVESAGGQIKLAQPGDPTDQDSSVGACFMIRLPCSDEAEGR